MSLSQTQLNWQNDQKNERNFIDKQHIEAVSSVKVLGNQFWKNNKTNFDLYIDSICLLNHLNTMIWLSNYLSFETRKILKNLQEERFTIFVWWYALEFTTHWLFSARYLWMKFEITWPFFEIINVLYNPLYNEVTSTALKLKFSIKGFFQ